MTYTGQVRKARHMAPVRPDADVTVSSPYLRKRQLAAGGSANTVAATQWRGADKDNAASPLRRPPVLSRPYDAEVATPVNYGRCRETIASILLVFAVSLRLLAITLCLLVVANALASGFARLVVLDATAAVTSALPRSVSGALTAPTVLGGSFRGDIAATAFILFVGDWLCVCLAGALRGREGR